MKYKIIHTELSKSTKLETILNTYYKIIYINHGKKTITINSNPIDYYKGELIYIRKNCNYSFCNITTDNKYSEFELLFTHEELQLIICGFPHDLRKATFSKNTPDGFKELIISQNLDDNLSIYFNNLLSLMNDKFVNSSQQIEWIKKTEFMYLLIKSEIKFIAKNLVFDIKSPKNNLIQIVNNNIFSKISIEKLASLCELSLSSFKKDFFNYYNTTPHKWIVLQRLERAKFMLISTDLEINEIADQCCFDNTSHFIKLFKKQFNLTPLKFRNNINKLQ